MIDLSRYIGIPWEKDGRHFGGCSCWGLVQLIYKEEFGIELPNVERAVKDSDMWLPVERQEFGDLLLFRQGPFDRHVGLFVEGGRMIHVDECAESRIETFKGLRWNNRLLRAYRCRYMTAPGKQSA